MFFANYIIKTTSSTRTLLRIFFCKSFSHLTVLELTEFPNLTNLLPIKYKHKNYWIKIVKIENLF